MTTDTEFIGVRSMARIAQVEDMHVRSEGDGREVEAYAAVFGVRSEVVDQDGHYREENAPTSFHRTIKHKGPGGFGVLFNHGRTIDGTPAGELTIPIGVPLEVKSDERGVYTRTRYLDNPLADSVLSAIKAGAIKAQSYSGRFMKSVRSYPEGRGRSSLPLIVRQEVDMREYGPAVFAQFPEAAITGYRTAGLGDGLAALVSGSRPDSTDPLSLFMRALMAMDAGQRLNFLQQFEITTPDTTVPEPEDLAGTPDEETGSADQTEDAREHSARSSVTDWRESMRERRARLKV